MRKIIGVGCITMGLVCLLVAVGFVFYNRYEEIQGEKNSQILLQELQTTIRETKQAERPSEDVIREDMPVYVSREMATTTVGNYESIGFLTIPVLGLDLPVLTDWSYQKLKEAPCHYYGSYYESDFVIAAHNNAAHFGKLPQLLPGDLVLFTNVLGETRYYEVVLLETLLPTATEEMITSGFDLSLYTCTRGGGSRVTVRCARVDY